MNEIGIRKIQRINETESRFIEKIKADESLARLKIRNEKRDYN